ncbi:MAG: hypothetical protein O2955_21775 [Planctomycetota bacterium]|nr:hypothetical protein [Planctomycetota bacterium]MDA1215137.1 hypothetical protein [Planctomycetota bacterium]
MTTATRQSTSLRRPVAEFCQRHAGEDIWVIAAAASMDYVEPEFFANKCVIGVNDVFKKYPCDYLVRKETSGAAEAFASGIPLIISEYDCGNRNGARNAADGTAWYYDHVHNECTAIDLSVVGTDRIVVSYSTITSAIHIAAYMGAANIIICGHDGGMLDGRMTYRGYYPEDAKFQKWYKDWVRQIMDQTRALRDRLKQVYGCQIQSLNPFIGLDLEGHRFET